jgi:hypothetical protein
MIKVKYLFNIPCLKSQPIHRWDNLITLTMKTRGLKVVFFIGFPSILAFDGAIEIAQKFTSDVLECSNVFNTLGNHHVV